MSVSNSAGFAGNGNTSGISVADALSRVQGNIVSKLGSESDKTRYINNYIAENGLESLYNQGQFSADQIASSILGQLDLGNPNEYIQSAYDIAMLNTMSSQALAREQMAYQTEANAKAMDFNATEAQKVRDWEKMMSDTAHQREVADLIAAGINPLLSANQGASTPAVANAQGVTSSGAKGSVDTSAVSAIMNAYQMAYQMKLQDKQIDAQLAMNLLNNETTRYAADKGAYASVSAAGLNSSAQRYAADINKWIYEEGYHGMGSMVGNVFENLMSDTTGILGSNNPTEAVENYLRNTFPWASGLIDSIFGEQKLPGRSSRAEDIPNGSGYRENERSSGYRSNR